jgi:hypothetical protein
MQRENMTILLLACVSLAFLGARRESPPPQSDQIVIQNLSIDQENTGTVDVVCQLGLEQAKFSVTADKQPIQSHFVAQEGKDTEGKLAFSLPEGTVNLNVTLTHPRGRRSEDFMGKTVFSGNHTSIRMAGAKAPPDYHVIDARQVRIIGPKSTYPLLFGKGNPPKSLAVYGGTVMGQLPISLTWHDMKLDYDGAALWVASRGTYWIQGLRAHNVEDGVRVLGKVQEGDTAIVSGLYLSYIRDDAIENESNTINLVFKDSLVDGTYMGFACRPAKGSSRYDMEDPPDATLSIEDTLLRLQAMPYRVGKEAPSGWGHAHLFKWSVAAPKKVIIRNSIFVVEQPSCQSRSAMRFPEGTVCENVTLIWLGGGNYPGKLPERGVTVTDDISIWHKAKAAWLQKHGYNPDPELPPEQNLMPLAGSRRG